MDFPIINEGFVGVKGALCGNLVCITSDEDTNMLFSHAGKIEVSKWVIWTDLDGLKWVMGIIKLIHLYQFN